MKIFKTSKCHNFLISQLIFIRFSLLCLEMLTLSSEIKFNLLFFISCLSPTVIMTSPRSCLITLSIYLYISPGVTTKFCSELARVQACKFLTWQTHFIGPGFPIHVCRERSGSYTIGLGGCRQSALCKYMYACA